MISILVFPLSRCKDPISVKEGKLPTNLITKPVDWSISTSDHLHIMSHKLWQQVYNNVNLYNQWKDMMNDNVDMGYVDTFERDEYAMRQENFDVYTYAIVVTHNNEYYGHIYAWRSPVEKNRLLVMGIRKRIDSITMENGLKNVSHLILEGARILALSLGCNILTVSHPFPVMASISEKLGFTHEEWIEGEVFGRSIASVYVEESKKYFGCDYCMSLSSLINPIDTRVNRIFLIR